MQGERKRAETELIPKKSPLPKFFLYEICRIAENKTDLPEGIFTMANYFFLSSPWVAKIRHVKAWQLQVSLSTRSTWFAIALPYLFSPRLILNIPKIFKNPEIMVIIEYSEKDSSSSTEIRTNNLP